MSDNPVAQEQNIIIWYTNADSLPNKMTELISRVESSTLKPSVITITEVKQKNQRYKIVPDELGINGYQMPDNNLDKDIRRGIITYIKDNLIVNEITMETNYEESMWVDIKVHDNRSIKIGTVYRSPNSSKANNKKLLKLIKESETKKSANRVIVGDFNYPDIQWPLENSNNKYDHPFISCISDCFLSQHIEQPTRARGTDNPTTYY